MMALIERDIAGELVDLRASIALGHDYVPATALEAALQRHLECEWSWRAVVAEQAANAERVLDVRGLS